METFKLIRKIFIIGAVIGTISWYFIVGLIVPEEFFRNTHLYPINYYADDFMFFILAPFIFIVPALISFKIISMIIEAVKKDTKNLKVFNDKKYLEAFSEVEENNIQNKELWAKAFAQCDGDIEKQKSIYVELRTKELSKGG